MNPITLSVIVPVYNEQFLVQKSLDSLSILHESPWLSYIKVIVVDDASTDQTPAALDKFQEAMQRSGWHGKFEWKFLRHEYNQGKGAAIRTALLYADTDLTVIHDADLEYHPADLVKMLPLFVEYGADVVYGSRFLVGAFKRVLFFRHTLGNHLLTFLCNLVCDLNLTDMETCYKMVRTALLKSIPLESNDFRIEPEMTIKLAKRGARFFEVPISYAGRTYQEGKKIHWHDGVRALGAILKYALSDHIYTNASVNPMRVRLSRAPRLNQWLAEMVSPYLGERVLELGAGSGDTTVHLLPRPLYWATDVNPLCLEDLRKLSQNKPYLRVAYVDITDQASFPTSQKFDTVVCFNVIAQVKDDVAALRNIRGALEDGGQAIVLVPQHPQLYGSLDGVLGHQRRYTREQLCTVAQQAGLRIKEVVDFNKLGTLAWWLNSCVLRRTRLVLWQIKLLNLCVPVLRHLERWLPLPSLSFIVILEKAS